MHLHLTHASLHPLEFTSHTESRSVQMSLYSSWQRAVLYNRSPLFLLKIAPSHWESNTCFLGLTQVHGLNGSLIGLCKAHGRHPTLHNGPPLPPLKLRLCMGDLDPHLIYDSLGPPKSSTQTVCRSVQWFTQGSRL